MSEIIKGVNIDYNEMSEVDLLQIDFNKYITKTTIGNDELSIKSIIKLEELDDIKNTIIESSNFLESFAKGEHKSWQNKLKSKIARIPYVGASIKDEIQKQQNISMLDKSVGEVLDNMFNQFEKKQDRLIQLSTEGYKLKVRMEEESVSMLKYVETLETIIHNKDTIEPEVLKAIKLSSTAQNYRIGLEENIHNKLNFINIFIRDLMEQMNVLLPMLKSGMEDNTEIAAIANSIKEASEMVNHIVYISKKIEISSTENVYGLIETLGTTMSENGVDKKYQEKIFERNKNFKKKMEEQNRKIVTKNIEDYNYLTKMTNELDNKAIEYRKETAKLIKKSTLNMLEDKSKDEVKEISNLS